MNLSLNLYSTPLWFGFIQGWIYAVLLWNRSRQNGRLSDVLLGLVLVGMTFSIWEYMLGFSGINILWEELEFLPRGFGFAFPPLWYFYFKSQIDSSFRFSRKDVRHFIPFLVHTVYHVAVYAQGHEFVRDWEQNVHGPYGIGHLEFFIGVILQIYYFYRSLKLYQHYRTWTKSQFSDIDSVSFKWYRNFLIVLALGLLADWLHILVDVIFQLSFEQDWWDNLLMVLLIYYVSIAGYAQAQPSRQVAFKDDPEPKSTQITTDLPSDYREWKDRIDQLMQHNQPYLQPELTLADVAHQLKTNTSVLSGVINGVYKKNFNDFVNAYRVEEFKKQIQSPQNKHLTLLAVALDCGFNSKSTFNRAFKNATGITPKEFLAGTSEK
jgi:AraC-like DNA-binding protein